MRSRKFFQLAVLLVLAFWIGSAMIDLKKSGKNSVEAGYQSVLTEEEDSLNLDTAGTESILDIVNLVNGPDMPKPTKEFRKGHVTVSDIKTTVKKTDYGFEIKLPANNGVPSPTYDKGDLYVSGGFGSRQFFSFDAETGEQKWGVDLDDDGPSSAVVKDGIVVFNSESCTIFAVEEESGEQLWSHWLGDPLMSTPTIDNEMVFTTYPAYGQFAGVKDFNKISEGKFNPTHVLVAMELKTGKILWQKWVDGDALMAPVAESNELHLTTFTGTYYVVDQESGEFKSVEKMRGTSAPTITPEGVVMSMRTDSYGQADMVSESIVTKGAVTDGSDKNSPSWNKKYEREEADYLDAKVQNQSNLKEMSISDDAGNGFGGGAPISANADMAMMNVGQSNVSSLQAFVGSRTLNYRGHNFNTMGDSVICTDAVSGEARWKMGIKGDSKTEGGFMGTPPIKVGDNILIATFNGDVILIDATTGKEKKRWSTGGHIRTQPIAENGWIFASTTGGKVIAINTEDKSIAGWPMLGKNIAHTN